MKKFNFKILILYILIILLLICKFIFKFNNSINSLLWFLIFIICCVLFKDDYDNRLNKMDKFQTIFITTISLLILYFLIGLFSGYSKNVQFTNLYGFIVNIWGYFCIIFFQEYIKSKLIDYRSGKGIIFVLITLIFILSDLPIYFGNSFFTKFQTIFVVIIPIVVRNILLTYITYTCGYKQSILYRVLVNIFSILLPILPSLNWFITSTIWLIIPIINYFIISYEINIEKRNISTLNKKKESPLTLIPFFLIIFIILGFILGLFNYEISGIMSNSMVPVFKRGDAIVYYKKIKKEDIKVGTIIKFKNDSKYIVHRVNKVIKTKDGPKYITKGDNNNIVDQDLISFEDIEGIYIFKIRYIGYPSVWFNEMINK